MTYDIAVVGGGIVGLATARELLRRHPGLKVANIEKEPAFARHQTGHNSGVIHSGIYYKPGSLKAHLCVEGRRAVWDYCEEHGIEYRQVGKLIVATEARELDALRELMRRGRENGIDELAWVDERGIREREPYCRGVAAIFSPVTGIVDWGRVALAYAADAQSLGAEFYLNHEVVGIDRRADELVLRTNHGEIVAKRAITCGGLYSDRLARMTGGAADPKIVPFRGDYLILRPERRYLVQGNIYPVPDASFPFLGVHFTPRMDGSVWLGPNAVLAFSREGYRFADVRARDLGEALTYPGFLRLAAKYWRVGSGEMYRALNRAAYVKALQRYIPELRAEDCLPGPSGVRAQTMTADGALVDDFVFEGDDRVVHVRNAPSPAATSSLAIGRYVVDDAERRFGLARVSLPGAAVDEAAPGAFVEAGWLWAHRDDPGLRIVDARSVPHGVPAGFDVGPSGRERYRAEHIAGAVHLDYYEDLRDPATPYAARVAPAERFAEILGGAGIGDGVRVVVYDDGDVPYATRLLWMLRYYGHDDVHVLAGGLRGWKAAGYPVTDAPTPIAPAVFTPHARPELRASRDEVLAVAEGRADAQLLDTQRDGTYALRDRDIRGAKRLSASQLLEDARGGRMAPRPTIDALVDALGLERNRRTIVSCGSGVGASGAYLALVENGFTDVAVYDGSWMEWSHDDLPTVLKGS